MREVMSGLVDKVADAGRADFAADICEPYPIPIICELLGAPKEDWQLFSRWAGDILEIFSADVVDKLDLIMRTQDELGEYTRGLIAERRSKPADDLLTDLIAAEEAGDKLTNDELVMMVNAVIVGGTDTTRNQLGCAVALFAEHPDQWALLAEQPELAPRAVEEAMRYFGAVRGTARFASCDIEYRDVLFPAGTFIVGRTGRGQPRFGRVQPSPRPSTSPQPPPGQPQLTFGSGIHYCLGAALARAELQEALPLLAQRMPKLAIDGDITWKPEGVGIFGPAHMPITFAAGPLTPSVAARAFRTRALAAAERSLACRRPSPCGSRPSPGARPRPIGSSRPARRRPDRPAWWRCPTARRRPRARRTPRNRLGSRTATPGDREGGWRTSPAPP